MSLITEEQVELQCIAWFKELGYEYKDGHDIAPEGVIMLKEMILEKLFLKTD